MADDAELQAQIAALSGVIDRHKSGQGNSGTSHRHSARQWHSYPGTPYGYHAGRGRGRGRGYHASPFKNRTLVLNNSTGRAASAGDSPSIPNSGVTANDMNANEGHATISNSTGWVSKRDRHFQLINTSVYEQNRQRRAEEIERTKQRKVRDRNLQEQRKLQAFLQQRSPSSDKPANKLVHSITVNGIRFVVAEAGSKLVRSNDEANIGKTTPKQSVVGGVRFVRSRHGNMYRAGLVKTSKASKEVKKSSELCQKFNTTGSCPLGPRCRFTHDPHKVAVCRDFLMNDKCSAGDSCDLSHDLTPERVPACVHFQRGKCNNESCRFTHVRVNPSALVCRSFAVLGYCDKGLSCSDRHVNECPEYSNKGFCSKSKCKLPHVDRAGQLRKAAARSASASSDENEDDEDATDDDSESELSGADSEDFDSDALSATDFAEQADYVKF